jgi:hypothetical protein
MGQGSTEGNSSNSLFWMMVALVCAMGILFGAGILVSSQVLSSMARPAGADNLTMHTPVADLRVEKRNEIGPGLPVYPHAALLLAGTNTAEALPHAKHSQSQITTYYTDDVPPLVESWYLQHLSSEFVRHTVGEPQAPPELDEVTAPIDSIAFLGERGDQIRLVTLTSNASGTRITLVRLTKPQAE